MIHVSGTNFTPRNFVSGKRAATLVSGGTALYREGLRHILAKNGFDVISMVGKLDDADHIVDDVNSRLIIIMSIQSAEDAPTDDIINARLRFPDSLIICICTSCDPDHVVPMLECGAAAILLCSVCSDTLVQTLELILLDHHVVPHLSLRAHANVLSCDEDSVPEFIADEPILPRDPTFQPSERELSIIACLIRGDSNRAIAERLSIAEGRVKGNVKAILRKIHVKNRTQAALWGMKYCSGSDRTESRLLDDALAASPAL